MFAEVDPPPLDLLVSVGVGLGSAGRRLGSRRAAGGRLAWGFGFALG